MHITLESDYAVRIVHCLARKRERMDAKRIAEETGKRDIPAGLANLDAMEVRFTNVIDSNVEAIEAAAGEFLSRS